MTTPHTTKQAQEKAEKELREIAQYLGCNENELVSEGLKLIAQTLTDYKDWLRAEMGGEYTPEKHGVRGSWSMVMMPEYHGYNTAHRKFIGLIERE